MNELNWIDIYRLNILEVVLTFLFVRLTHACTTCIIHIAPTTFRLPYNSFSGCQLFYYTANNMRQISHRIVELRGSPGGWWSTLWRRWVSSWRRRCWARRLGTRGPWPCARRPAGALKPPDASWVAVWKLPRMAEEKLPGTRGAGEVSGQPFNHCCGCKFLETIKWMRWKRS